MTRLGKAAIIVSAGILVSRLLGFLRTMALAAILGATQQADLFQDAFTIPDILFYLMAGGFLSITLIPILTRHLDDEREEWRSFTAVVRPVAIAMATLTVIAMVLARPIVGIVFREFAPSQLDQLAHLMRIVFPAQVFFVLGSLLMAVQYAHKRFLIPVLAPIVYNLAIIVGGLATASGASADGFVWGALAGAAIGNFGLQWYGARRLGLRWERSVPWNHPALKEYLFLALPLMLGQSVAVLDEQLLKVFGQLAETGATGLLAYARRLNMLPVGMIAQAAGVAAYPFLASLFSQGRRSEFDATITRALRYGIFVGCGAAAAVAGAALPAVRLAFQRGRFGPDDTLIAAGLLVIYSVSIPFWASHQLYARAFYAQRRMWMPVGIGTAATGIAIPLYFWFFHLWGIEGIALASSVSIIVYSLGLGLAWHVGTTSWHPLVATWWRSAVAAIVAGYATWGVVKLITRSQVPGVGASLAAIGAGAVVVAVVYAGLSRLLGGRELTDLLRRTG
jgi:putative peptidoglycan lipid II flippase